MIPIALFGNASVASLLTLAAVLAPAVVAWWNDRRLLGKGDDPALPELLADRRRRNVRAVAIGIAVVVVVGGSDAVWGIPLLLAVLIAAAYPLRTRLLGETWGFGAYVSRTVASIAGGFGFWIALAYVPIIVERIVDSVGMTRAWLVVALSLTVVALLFAWEAWYPRLWIWAHAGERLTSPELTPRFDEVVRKAGTIVPTVYRVGPQGSRFVNAVALPSVRRPSIALGNALLDLLDADETVAIFAHEVAHFDHFTTRRMRRARLLNRALIVIGAALPLVAAFTHVAWVPWIGWVWPVLVLVALARRAGKSQQHETESDLRAAALCGDPEALVRGLVKLHAHARIPRRYAVDIERAASHPSLVRRIQAIRAGGPAAVEQLGAATVVRSTQGGSWVVLDDTRSYWLDGVPDGTEPRLASLRDAASSYRVVNYQDLVELRVVAAGEARTIAARTGRGDRWSVPIAAEDVARVQRALDVVDLRLGKAGPAPARGAPKIVALVAFVAAFISGQAGVVLAPILVAMSKPSAAALAALGAMSIVRAVLGAAEGSNWFDQDLVRVGLVVLALTGGFAISTAMRLVRGGEGAAYRTLTLGVLIAVTVIVGVAALVQVTRVPSTGLAGSSMMGTFGTALAGVAAALLTLRARWGRPAAYAGLGVAAVFAALGVDRTGWRLRRALAEDAATAVPVASTELGGVARGLRVSPDGRHFLATRVPGSGVGRAATPRLALVAGRVGGPVRDVPGVDADFVDSVSILVVDVLDSVVTLRVEGVDSGPASPVWADTIAGVALVDPRLVIDRGTGSWAVIGTDADSDRMSVYAGKIGERGATRRAAVPDTIPVVGEPLVFDEGATVIVPGFERMNRAQPGMPALSLWTLALFGLEGPPMQLYRVHGDSVRVLAPVRGGVQCGEPLGGSALCAVQRLNATLLYAVSSREASAVAQLSLQDFHLAAPGPGLRAGSMSIDRGGVVLVDLAARRLTRVSMPTRGSFATEVRSGPGWIVTLGYGQNQRSAVRAYRIDTAQ